MAEPTERSYASGLMLGVALALILALIVYAVILPQQRRGGLTLPDIDVESPGGERPAPGRDAPDGR